MADEEKVVGFISNLLSNFVSDTLVNPLVKPIGNVLFAWLKDKQTQKALLDAARNAESDFRKQAMEKFGNDKLTQAVASFPIHNGELFQSALQSLPSHFNETFLASHLSSDLLKNWRGEFSEEEIRTGIALYVDCLRVRLLQVNGFAEIVTRLAVLRTDRRTELMQEDIKWIQNKLLELTSQKDAGSILFLHQLPPPPADFTGREVQITELLQDFDSHKGATISGLTGMGGIGKTALGLVVANQLKEKYPDAQIYLDLKGTTTPLTSVDIARHVILSFEPTADLRALEESNMQAAYQSVLHGKKVLLFLDNARSAEQIAPLRPPETCAMLVTSRWTFSVPGLGTRRVDVMDKNDAKDFLIELCPRVEDQAANLAKACAYLPLALRIAGSFLQVNSNWSIEKYLSQLNDRKRRLETLKQSKEDAELTTEPDLLATFELSYNQLSEENQKRWRILGVFPASFTWTAAATMWDLEDENETTELLDLMKRYSLLEYDVASSRHSMHDLLVDYSLSKMEGLEEKKSRAIYAKHYLEVLKFANELYSNGGENVIRGLQIFDWEWQHISFAQLWVKENSDARDILELCNEYPNAGYMILILRLHPRIYANWLETGLNAARSLGNKKFEGYHLGNLGLAYAKLGDKHKAIEFYEEALGIDREIGDRHGEGIAFVNLGNAYAELGEVGKAIEFHEKALGIDREIGDRRGEGIDLGNLGNAYSDLGEVGKAIEFYEEALVIDREIGDRHGEVADLCNLGTSYKRLGEASMAIRYYEQALNIANEIGDIHSLGSILFNQGLALFSLEEKEKAIDLVKKALIIYEKIESPFAERARDTLKKWGAVE